MKTYVLASVIVPNTNIIVLVSLGVLCIFGPIVGFTAFRKKFDLEYIPFFTGVGVFLVIYLFMQRSLGSYLMSEGSDFYDSMISNPALYMIFSGVFTGVFQCGGRYIALLLLKRKYTNYQTSSALALGYGATRLMFMLGVSYITYAWLSFGNNYQVISDLPSSETLSNLFIQLSRATPMFFFGEFYGELISICLQLGLTALVWQAVNKPGSTYFLFAAIVFSIIMNAPIALRDVAVITNNSLIYMLLTLFAVITLTIASIIKKADMRSKTVSADPFSLF